MSPPPTVLKSAIYNMRSDQSYLEPGQHILSQELLRLLPQRPTEPDILFKADYIHPPDQSSCEQCDSTKIVNRPQRPDHHPLIRYGLVASGDGVIKKAATRDGLKKDLGGNVLCFEMEAAGIIQEFPAVVIRGISDYADSHKNDSWHHYAATAAAICAKKLLTYLESENMPSAAPQPSNEPVRYGPCAATSSSDDLLKQFLADICESDPYNEMTRIKQSKGELLEQCYYWIIQSPEMRRWNTESNERVLWLKGGPGKGKTMAMIGMVQHISNQKTTSSSISLSFFFCQHGIPHLSNAVSMLRGLIWKLLWVNRDLGVHIPDEYKCKDNAKDIFDGPNAFAILTTMLSRMLADKSLDAVLIFVDAIDECDSGMYQFLEWVIHEASRPTTKGRWLISGRDSPIFQESLCPSRSLTILNLEVNEAHMSRAVEHFIEYKVKQLAEAKDMTRTLQKDIETTLKAKAESTFLWVALVCPRLRSIRLGKIQRVLEDFPSGLEALYDRMLRQVESHEDEGDRRICLKVISTAVLACRPLKFDELCIAAGFPKEIKNDMKEIVKLCGSFFIVRCETVFLLHQTANDYFCTGPGHRIFSHGTQLEHGMILQQLLKAMDAGLGRDMYRLRYAGFAIEDIIQPQPDPLASLHYALVCWTEHLEFSCETCDNQRPQDNFVHGEQVHTFMTKHFLHWIEALAVIRQMRVAPGIMKRLQRIFRCQFSSKAHWLAVVEDAYQFILYNKAGIEAAPLQTYYSALVFSPRTSLVKNIFHSEIPPWLRNPIMLDKQWSPCLQVFEGHTDAVCSVLFSPDNHLLISGSADNTVRIWNTEDGVSLHTLKSHTGSVVSLAVSPEGKWIASAAMDSTFRVWYLQSGHLHKIGRTNSPVCSMAFTLQDQNLIVLNDGGQVQVWETHEGVSLHAYQLHPAMEYPMVLAPNGTWIASACEDGTVRLGDARTGNMSKMVRPVETTTSITFTSSGKEMMTIADDCIINIWNVETGCLLRCFDGNTDRVVSAGLLSDNRWVAIAAYETMRFWDLQDHVILQAFAGHNEPIHTVAMSSDGLTVASASRDKTLRLWDAEPCTLGAYSTQSMRSVDWLVFSPNSELVASGSCDHMVRLWSATMGIFLQAYAHTKYATSAAFSSDNQRLATTTIDRIIRIWDCSSGAILQQLDSNSASFDAVIDINGLPAFNTEFSSFPMDCLNFLETTCDRLERIEYHRPWIIFDGKKVLWLPVTYSPHHFVVRGSIAVIGCYTGQLLFLNFESS